MIPVSRVTFANAAISIMLRCSGGRVAIYLSYYPANSTEALHLNVFLGKVKGLTGVSA